MIFLSNDPLLPYSLSPHPPFSRRIDETFAHRHNIRYNHSDECMENDRYSSAAGWDGRDREARILLAEYQKRFEDYKRKHASDLTDDTALTLETSDDIFQPNARPTRQLFGDFFSEGQLAILFADTGVGKSMLAVQIADAIAMGRDTFYRTPTTDFNCLNEVGDQKVVYIDFELTNEQFAARYSEGVTDGEYDGQHDFSPDNFLRARIEWDDDIPKAFDGMDDFIIHSIARITGLHPDAKVLIIDNITYLISSATSMGESLRLMKSLKALKDNGDLSILVIAHSPKSGPRTPLTVNDLQGSKMLSNFADSIFAIGQCFHEPDVRYIKQIKTRISEMKFHQENVIACRIVKTKGFPHFAPFALTPESNHLTRTRKNPTDATPSASSPPKTNSPSHRDA